MRLATILISGLFAATAAAQCNYDVIGLPEYPCGQSIGSAAPSDMNNEGVIVGWWQQCNGEDHAIYYWSPKDGLHPEFFLPPTAHTAEAIAINDKGNFTGSARDGLNKAFGWAWIDGAYQIINIPPGMGNAIEPVGINNHDEIVGWLGTPPLGERSAFRWKDGVLTILDVDSTNAGAFGINDNGQIAGLYVAGGPAFLLEGDRLTSLPALPDATSHRVRRINEHGVIVGRTSIVDPEISFTATRWCDGEVTDLGVLPGSDYSVAVGINRFGTIIAQGADDWILVNDSITPLAELADGFDGT
ncbi:MAG: hypothetical protein KDA25_13095, partial [Phycisphaerales bacterium]|nr:hypothetical protein [Phycisphaerales bacterium]